MKIPTPELRQAILDVVRGDRHWRELNQFGIAIDLTDSSVEVAGFAAHPLKVSAPDVAAGLVQHSLDESALREWARVIHGATTLIEFDMDHHPQGERLLDAVWRLSFGDDLPWDTLTVARTVANTASA